MPHINVSMDCIDSAFKSQVLLNVFLTHNYL